MWPFTRKTRTAPDALIWLNDTDYITRHQAYEGILGMGATGSGKSTVLAHVMESLMKRHAGMLILTASESDYPQIRQMAIEVGREADLIRFAPSEPWRFDFLNWILENGSVAEAAQLMQDLVDFTSKMDSGNSKEPFWPMSASRQIRMAITLLYHSAACCSVSDVYKFITSMPKTPADLAAPEFQNTLCNLALQKTYSLPKTLDAELAVEYVCQEFPRLSDRTGPCITAVTMNVLERFMHGTPRELLASGETDVSPQTLDEGKIIVIDMPILKDREPGRFAQVVWKTITQRYALKRTITPQTRDIVLWMDEAQLHALPSVDSQTQAVARKHKLIQVAITQNIPLLVSSIKNKEDTTAWIGNLQTKFIFANGDNETNEFFSKLFGQVRKLFTGYSPSNKPYDFVGDIFGQEQAGGFNISQQMQPAVRPEKFVTLRKGGAENGFLVDCYIAQGGRKFSNGQPFIKATIAQRISEPGVSVRPVA